MVREHDVLHSIVANITPCQYKQQRCLTVKALTGTIVILKCATVDPVTNDLASARQKKSLVTESLWSQE